MSAAAAVAATVCAGSAQEFVEVAIQKGAMLSLLHVMDSDHRQVTFGFVHLV